MTEIKRLFEDLYPRIAGEADAAQKLEEEVAMSRWQDLTAVWREATDNPHLQRAALSAAKDLFYGRQLAMTLLGYEIAAAADRKIVASIDRCTVLIQQRRPAVRA